MNLLPSEREMGRALRRRDPSYDGVFFVAVRTTGVFCRPSCPARRPSPANVEYFATVQDAQRAGYRPCKRCRPLDATGQPPEWVERLLVAIAAMPADRCTDTDLRLMSLEPARVRRFFRTNYGMTFQAYHRALRMGLALAEVRRGAELNGVALRHGYDSSSGFRDAFARTFGGPPGARRDVRCVLVRWLQSPLGLLLAGATGEGVCLLEFVEVRTLPSRLAELRSRLDAAIVPGSNGHLETLGHELARYFSGDLTEFSVPIAYEGTAFQLAVWDQLRRIPSGQTLSYEELARRVGRPGAQRAVGQANHVNPMAILVPCHRVVQKDGQLRGYGAGLWRKQFLLNLEREARNRRGLD